MLFGLSYTTLLAAGAGAVIYFQGPQIANALGMPTMVTEGNKMMVAVGVGIGLYLLKVGDKVYDMIM